MGQTCQPSPPPSTPVQFKELMELCWSPDVAKRPTFKEIVGCFQVR